MALIGNSPCVGGWLRRFALALVLVPISAFAGGHDALRERAGEALGKFRVEMAKAQAKAVAASDPTRAVEYCRDEAPKLAVRFSGKGLDVGRSSHKVRNQDNAPKEWMLPILKGYGGSSHQSPGEPVFVPIGGGRFGYAEPIYVEGHCTVCHGGTMDPSIEATLKKRYPKDEATGFEFGEFRGIFWVEIGP